MDATPLLLASPTPGPARQDSSKFSQLSESQSPASLLGKRDAEGFTKRPQNNTRTASRFRGVTLHSRTNRYEAHVWQEGKQVYLGGFGVEEQAALSYDLAAIKFRGAEAIVNFDMENYQQELETADLVSRDDVVQCLRNQSKAMNRLDTGSSSSSSSSGGGEAVRMDAWELAISEALQQDKWQHVGVFGSEADAARAYDRALLGRKGVDALLSFPLQDYLPLLDAVQVEEAMGRGLLPTTLPLNFAPSQPPVPLLHISHALQPIITMRPHVPSSTSSTSGASSGMAATSAHGGTAVAEAPAAQCGIATVGGSQDAGAVLAPVSLPGVRRKASVTPRSVMDFDAAVAAAAWQEEAWAVQLSGKPTANDPTLIKQARANIQHEGCVVPSLPVKHEAGSAVQQSSPEADWISHMVV